MKVRLGELAERVGCMLHGDPDCEVQAVGPLDSAEQGLVGFIASDQYLDLLGRTRVAAVILSAEHLGRCPVNALVADNPHLCYARVASLLHPEPEFSPGIHPTAVVAEGSHVDSTAWIGPHAVVEAGAEIGARVFVGPGSLVASGARVGEESRLIARVTICHHVVVGRRVVIHPGAVIGSDGFGLAKDGARWVKVPQLGTVLLGDDVEIGANTTVDRGALQDTVIADGAKLDNQIQIAHNVRIGENTAIAACVGIAGSTKVGRNCTLGGGVGLAGHLEFGDNVHFTGQSLVTRSFTRPGQYSGNLPAVPTREWRRSVARFRHLDEMAKRLRYVEERLAQLPPDELDESS